MGQTSTPRKRIWVGTPQWRKIRAAIRKEAIGYVTKAVFAALMAAILFSLHRVENDLPALLQASKVNTSIISFASSAHSVAVAEMEFLRAVQETKCNTKFFDNDLAYVVNRGDLDLTGTCAPTQLDSQGFLIRAELMDSITLYSDALAAMAVRGSNQGLDPDSQKLAARLASLAKSGATGLDPNDSFNTALSRICSFALDSSEFSSPEAAATAYFQNRWIGGYVVENDQVFQPNNRRVM